MDDVTFVESNGHNVRGDWLYVSAPSYVCGHAPACSCQPTDCKGCSADGVLKNRSALPSAEFIVRTWQLSLLSTPLPFGHGDPSGQTDQESMPVPNGQCLACHVYQACHRQTGVWCMLAQAGIATSYWSPFLIPQLRSPRPHCLPSRRGTLIADSSLQLWTSSGGL